MIIRGNHLTFSVDEFPNRNTSLAKLGALKAAFMKDGSGTVTAGNASGINDGAAFVMLASEDFCVEHNVQPFVEVIDTAFVGCNPQLMGLGPFYAIEKLLNNTDLEFEDIDYFEINEAFAAQTLACYQLLSNKYNMSIQSIIDKTNIKGSGLGLGHPLGATGARVTTTLTHILKDKHNSYGIASLCIGGGMGAAILLRSL